MTTYFSPPEAVAEATVRRLTYPDFFRVTDGLLAGNADLLPDEYVAFGETKIEPGPLEQANVVTSRVGVGETHKVAIDLDMDAVLVPTSTPGHHHLIINHELTWENYKKLLEALESVGLIQGGYFKASVKRGATVLRTPWTKKGEE